jgi:CheY-like chemotaxis protein
MSSITKKRRILLVEDEAVVAVAAKNVLAKQGYEVEHSTTGERAVEAVTTNREIDRS